MAPKSVCQEFVLHSSYRSGYLVSIALYGRRHHELSVPSLGAFRIRLTAAMLL